jgi:hypothetical protein
VTEIVSIQAVNQLIERLMRKIEDLESVNAPKIREAPTSWWKHRLSGRTRAARRSITIIRSREGRLCDRG